MGIYETPWEDLITCSPTANIQEAYIKHYTKFREHNAALPGQYSKILVSISGGSDSDIMLDMIERIGYRPGTVQYVFFDTGLEFTATKQHIAYLEKKYQIQIARVKAKHPIPGVCKKYGQPFLSKQVSEWLSRLQKHGFQWEDEPLPVLLEKYPRCKAALRWWCNDFGANSQLNISHNTYLKAFLQANPPTFNISNLCCFKAKKDTAAAYKKDFQPDLDVQGIRKSEGGARSIAYTSCFDDKSAVAYAKLRPVFWFTAEDKRAYDRIFGVTHSKCYSTYGLCRTGCSCCPFGQQFETELAAAKEYEPKLYNAAMHVFGASYEYTRAYRAFQPEAKKLGLPK